MARAPRASTSKAATTKADTNGTEADPAPVASTSKAKASRAHRPQKVVTDVKAEDVEMPLGSDGIGKPTADEVDDEIVKKIRKKQSSPTSIANGSRREPVDVNNGANGVQTEADNDDDEEPPKVSEKAKGKRRATKTEADEEALTDLEELEGGAKPKKRKAAGTSKRVKKYKGPALEPMTYPERHLSSNKFVGSHVTITGGAHYAPHNALRLGAKAFGMFTKNQKAWKGPPLSEDSLRLFPMRCSGKSETIPDADGKFESVTLGDGLGFDAKRHIVPHGSYLTNLCNPDPEVNRKSYENFIDELKRAESLGIGLFNFHPGTTVGKCTREEAYKQLASCINRAHKETTFVVILLENMAHGNNTIGSTFEDLAAIIALVDDKSRVGVCYDTCHGFAGGYDMRDKAAYDATFETFERIVGTKYIRAFHLNDSEKGLGEHRDLHANIGTGQIGLLGFQCLMQDPRFDGLPFILETPMLQGTLQLDEKKPRKSPKKEGKEEDAVEATNGTTDTAQPTLSKGASTWKMEIELLHALESCELGTQSEKVQTLFSEISAIVTKYKEDKAKAAAEKKAEAARIRAEKKAGLANGETDDKKAKGKGKSKVKTEEESGEDEEMKAEEEEEDQAESDCDSHSEN